MTTNKKCSTRTTRLGLKPGCYALIGAAGLLLAAPAMARAESARFDIAAQPLSSALRRFAVQAQMQLLYEQSAVANASGNAVIGELDKQAALEQLLRNTGLEVVYSSESEATIRPAADKQVEESTATDPRGSDQLRLAQVGRTSLTRESSRDSGKSVLEEVIVTARRHEESLQAVPIAVTVVGQEKLQQNNVQTIGDLQYLVPSMTSSVGLTRDAPNVSIRGQGANSISGLPGVVAYINEVPIPTDQDANLAGGPGLFFDLENVQVLKGPQGTLFGRNSVGGALLLQTARPKNEFGGRIQVGYGNYNNREVDAAINLPIAGETLLARVAFNGDKRDGFTRLQGTPAHPDGIDVDDRDYWSVRGTVTFHPVDWLKNDAIATYSKWDSNGSPAFLYTFNPTGLAPTVFPQLSALFAQQTALGGRTIIPLDTNIVSAGHTLSINNITSIGSREALEFRNIVGYVEANTVLANDFDASPLPVFNQPSTPRDLTVRQLTEEAQLLGKSFGDRLDWITGGFYLGQPMPSYFHLQTGTAFGLPNDSEGRRAEWSRALFAQGTYDLSALLRGLKLTGGVRYTWDRRKQENHYNGVGTRCTPPRDGCDTTVSTAPASSALTWTAGLNYQVTPRALLYITSRRGYRAGGTNGNFLPNFRPEYVTDVELGSKSDLEVAGIPIRANAAVYYQDYTDIQVQRSASFGANSGNIVALVSNAAAARLWGAELEAQMQLTDDLQLGITFDYLNMRFTEFEPGVDPAPLRALETAGRPPHKYGANARYRLPLSHEVGDLSIQANWSRQDSNGDVSEPGGVIPAFSLLNASVNWEKIADGPVDVSLFCSNATNQRYYVGGFAIYNIIGFSTQRLGEPRMYGIRLRYRFGAE